MKTYLLAGAIVTLAAAPYAASAQAVGSYMRPGAVTQRPSAPVGQVPTMPAPNAVFQNTPMRTGPIFAQPVPRFNSSHSGPVVVIPETPPIYHFSQLSSPQRAYGNNERTYGNEGRRDWPQPGYSNEPADRPDTPIGPGNGYFNNSIPPIGPGNGFFNNLTPPVGPANGFGSTSTQQMTPGCPPLLGGYYYGNYCETALTTGTYPSVYSVYSGFPQYIFQPNVVVVGQPEPPVYITTYQPFSSPTYTVNYNNNYYYVANEDRARQLEAGGDQAQAALQNAYPANSYQAAFGDIARAWTDGDIKPLRKHIRDSDTRLSVFLNKKYSYSIASGDFVQITRDAFSQLYTVSFEFTRIRKAKNGDVTAYGKHVYRAVPPDQSGNDGQTNDQTNAGSVSDEKTVYVSYTLRHRDDLWYITRCRLLEQ